MEKEYELKHTVSGPEERPSKEVRILNRTVCWAEDGIQCDCGHRHADTLGSQPCMDGLKPLSSLDIPESIECIRKEDENKHGREGVGKRAIEQGLDSFFRAPTARTNYVAQDPPDLCVCKRLRSQLLSGLTPSSPPPLPAWQALTRIGRKLVGARRVSQTFR